MNKMSCRFLKERHHMRLTLLRKCENLGQCAELQAWDYLHSERERVRACQHEILASFTSNSSKKLRQHSPLTVSLGKHDKLDSAILTGYAQLFASWGTVQRLTLSHKTVEFFPSEHVRKMASTLTSQALPLITRHMQQASAHNIVLKILTLQAVGTVAHMERRVQE